MVNELLAIGYVGLFIFALNGLQWMALNREKQKLRVQEEEIRRLLLRIKLGGRR